MSNEHPKHLAYISGCEIVRLEITPGIYPKHKEEVDGLTVWHINYAITNPHHFLEHNYYNSRSDELLTRPSKPNPISSWDGGKGEWVWEHERLLNNVRASRNLRLNTCDWTQVPDVQLTEAERDDWRNYRQALRDITNNCDDITCLDDVVWPTEPTGE